jgi:hypothetical protein
MKGVLSIRIICKGQKMCVCVCVCFDECVQCVCLSVDMSIYQECLSDENIYVYFLEYVCQ